MPVFAGDGQFSVCKIEAGKAILLSEDDYELLEVPAKLIPHQSVGTSVCIRVEPYGSKVNNISAALAAVKQEYSVSAEDTSQLKEAIGAEGFFKVDSIGCSCATLSWEKSLLSLLEGIRGGRSVVCEAVDLVRLTTRESLPIVDGSSISQLRLDLSWTGQVEVALLFRTSIGSFWTGSLSVCRAEPTETDFSSVWLVTDLPASDGRIKTVLERGGKISNSPSSCNSIDCITAVVVDARQSELFEAAVKAALPAVNYEWLELLLATNRLPANYSDFQPRTKQ